MSLQYAFLVSSFGGVRKLKNNAFSGSEATPKASFSGAGRRRHAEHSVMLLEPSARTRQLPRRAALQFVALGIATAVLSGDEARADSDFSIYKGPISLGFSFSYPSTWAVKKKPIKTHLSEVLVTSDKESSTNAGLVVDSVKIESIDKFGTPEVVGRRVVDVETKKESVNSATVLGAESVTKDGLTYYILDYVVDSSRGVKRYLAKATITGGQLYVFTAQAKTGSFEGDTQNTFKKMLESFTVARQYL